MTAHDLDALVERFGLAPAQADRLDRLLAVLESDPHAPTAVRDRAAAIDVHLADSLVALDLDSVRAATTSADLGSGAGLPGLALAAALPELPMSLVESNRRKCSFLERAREAAGITNAVVVCERAETWSGGRGACDLVTARALAPLAVVLEYAAPLLRVEGFALAWKGGRDRPEERQARAAAAQLGLELDAVLPVQPYPGSRERHLHSYRKAADTPPRFPRRPGVARKRPLGAGSEVLT